jgi:asparagine synthase (glutamine-hydrolysing)
MISKVRQFGLLWRYLGPGWLAYRLSYAAAQRTGRLRRRNPPSSWEQRPLADFLIDKKLSDPSAYLDYRRTSAPRFFFTRDDLVSFKGFFSKWDEGGENPVQTADEILDGTLRYFSFTQAKTGFPPDWHTNALTGESTSNARHWSEIGDFGSGDIKVIWEPSRFAFAYTLVRAYQRTLDERYAEAFWASIEDWREKNPPQQGVNWKCGQEISFRVMAWCFGLYGLLDAQATTHGRVMELASMIAVSGERIASNIEYALSQRNNHGISEGMGLWTIGLLFPELRAAAGWRKRGREVLELCGRELIYDDGAFSQHSVNYHRLMLHDYVWALRLGELLGEYFSDELKIRLAMATEFLYQIQDSESGRVPCYGQNDGALILPLDNCDYQDYRPAIGAAYYLLHNTRLYENGNWDEALLWLYGTDAVAAPVSELNRTDLRAGTGGYYTLRSEESWAFTRCAEFLDRPAQADLLHLDLWWRHQNIAIDPGTFSYNAPEPWNNALAATSFHNTVTVDGLDQMYRAGKFLWLPWAKGKVRCTYRSTHGQISYWEGEHNGYRRLREPVTHRRAVIGCGAESWLVLDELRSEANHSYRLHWLLSEMPYRWDEETGRLNLETPEGCYFVQTGAVDELVLKRSLSIADDGSPRGWQSPYYARRAPALSQETITHASSCLFWTLFTPEPCDVKVLEKKSINLKAKHLTGQLLLDERRGEGHPLLASLTLEGMPRDELIIS